MDIIVSGWLNSLISGSEILSALAFVLTRELFKNLPPILLIWMLWFSSTEESRIEVREKLLSVLGLAIVAIGAGRFLATALPFRHRPLYDESVEVFVAPWMDDAYLDGWSSFPSDHAVLFFAMATGLFLVKTRVGIVALCHAFFIVCIPRIAVGWHWPTDIIVGAFVGSVITLVLMRPARLLVQRLKIIPLFEANASIGYPLLFLATYELSRLFYTTRRLLDYVLG